jgi:hypothetical protein
MARSGRLRRPGRGLRSEDQSNPKTSPSTTLEGARFRLIVDGWATFDPGTCAPPRRALDEAVSPSTIRLKQASTIAEIRTGVSDPADPRLATYSSLYAYAISYDCTGISYCLAIPAPTAANPIGLAPGSPFFVMGRKYLEPRTRVRPALSEITPHRSMQLSAP